MIQLFSYHTLSYDVGSGSATTIFGNNVGAMFSLAYAYGAPTKHPVLCTHYNLNKGIQTVSHLYPTPICVK